uniref:Uncharacterized protein n=1 Tax=Trypanosoma congolense (strain IL3000) TaxID=1068625 RepID=G0UJL4_TRYCI|nr:conserved hypothetical protein [Trypanosoma congolense IL3000]
MSFRGYSFTSNGNMGFPHVRYDAPNGCPPEGLLLFNGSCYMPHMNMGHRPYGGGAYLPGGSFLMSRGGSRYEHGSNAGSSVFPACGMGDGNPRSFGGHGSLGFGPMAGGSFYDGAAEQPAVVQKLFSSRRDRGRFSSEVYLLRSPSDLSLGNRNTYTAASATSVTSNGGVAREPLEDEGSTRAVSSGRNSIGAELQRSVDNSVSFPSTGSHLPLPRSGEGSQCVTETTREDLKSPVCYDMGYVEEDHDVPKRAFPEHESPTDVETTQGTPGPAKNVTGQSKPTVVIPLSKTVGEVVHGPVRVATTFGNGADIKLSTASALYGGEKTDTNPRSRRSSIRRNTSHRTRATSAVNIAIAEFPRGEEVQDNLECGISQPKRSLPAPRKLSSTRLRQPIGLSNEQPSLTQKVVPTKVESSRVEEQHPIVTQKHRNSSEKPINENRGGGARPQPSDPMSVVSQDSRVCATGDVAAGVKEVSKTEERREPEKVEQQQQQPKDPKSNPVKTVVLVEKVPSAVTHLSVVGNKFSYRGKGHEAHEVVFRNPGSANYHSSTLNSVKNAVCDGYNAALLSVEAPNSNKMFQSPVWPFLTRTVRSVLQQGQKTPNSTVSITAALGFFHNDKVRDLSDEGKGAFEAMQVQPSPIYGPRIPQLRYSKVASSTAYDESLNKALKRASSDSVLLATKGVVAAFLLVKQCRKSESESGDTTHDVLLSSLVVASSGSDMHPFDSAISRVRNEYCMLFHLVLGGPSYTCFMLSLSTASEGADESSVKDVVEGLIELHDRMHSAYNYPLRNGSVTRFVKYVMRANKEGMERLKHEEDQEKRGRLERYVQEQSRLLNDANKMLKDAQIELQSANT